MFLTDLAGRTTDLAAAVPTSFARSVTTWVTRDRAVARTTLTGVPAGTSGSVVVEWTVATDPELRDVVASGVTRASAADGHLVTVELHGLRPDRVHHVAFEALGDRSAVAPILPLRCAVNPSPSRRTRAARRGRGGPGRARSSD